MRILELRYADDLSQTAAVPARANIPVQDVLTLLRARRNARYKQLNNKGVTLEPGDPGIFIGLNKLFNACPGLVLLRPSCNSVSDLSDVTDFIAKSSFQHFLGWYPSGLPYATFCGMAARAVSLSSNPTLAQETITEYCELFLNSARYPAEFLRKLACKWDRLHPGAAVTCTRAVADAIICVACRS